MEASDMATLDQTYAAIVVRDRDDIGEPLEQSAVVGAAQGPHEPPRGVEGLRHGGVRRGRRHADQQDRARGRE